MESTILDFPNSCCCFSSLAVSLKGSLFCACLFGVSNKEKDQTPAQYFSSVGEIVDNWVDRN